MDNKFEEKRSRRDALLSFLCSRNRAQKKLHFQRSAPAIDQYYNLHNRKSVAQEEICFEDLFNELSERKNREIGKNNHCELNRY
jgi:hypothetical protein